VRAQVHDLGDAQRRHKETIAGRDAALYRRSSAAALPALMAAESPAQALHRSTYVGVLQRGERRQLEAAEATRTALGAEGRRLAAEERTLQRMLDEQRVLEAEAAELRQARAFALAARTSEIAALEQQEQLLEAESRELATLASRAAAIGAAREAPSRTSAPSRASRAGGATRSGWVWPARGPVTSGYGRRWDRQHEGIDIGVGTGSPLYAAADGTVSFAGPMGGYGNLTLIDHGGGVVTAYAHQSRFGVRTGERVRAGAVIGSSGSTGNVTGPHLHSEVRVNGTPRNPRGHLP
jgi:murein DD-endopeptidase MepM/ murein hydrolase activator NlpD